MTAAARKRVAIVQSSYIPWKGYFDLIGLVDEFIVFDDRQYTSRDWRNRNRIKTARGSAWLTVPVVVKGRRGQRIDEVRIADPGWAADHWRALSLAYARAPHFAERRAWAEGLYARAGGLELLSAVNRLFIDALCATLGITTRITRSADYEAYGAKTERLVALCRAAGATEYLSGPAARAYLDEAAFAAAGISVAWMDYEGYPEYPQLHGPFDHHVSVLDLVFNVGDAAPRYLKSTAGRAAAHA